MTGDPAAEYVLTLFVSGASERSGRAVAAARALCDEHLGGRHRLEVVDVRRDPSRMPQHVVATPTLVRERPLPRRVLVGDLSDTGRVLRTLGVATPPAPVAPTG